MTTFELVIGTIIPTSWIAWLLYWWLSARNAKATRGRVHGSPSRSGR